jgi:hypothetical protein
VTGEPEVEMIKVTKRIPLNSLVTITFYKNGKPKSATCQKVTATPTKQTDVGGLRNRPRYKDIWNEVMKKYAPKFKGKLTGEERDAIRATRREEYISRSEKEHPESNPWGYGKSIQVSNVPTKKDIANKLRKITDPEERSKAFERSKCTDWPFFADKRLPRDVNKIQCEHVKAAVLFALGETGKEEIRVWPYEDVTKTPIGDEPRRYTSPEFVADDKMASRFDRIYKLSLMD